MHNFEVKGKIGEGSFAAVYKVRRIEDGIVYAMKRIAISNTSKREVANCLNEVRILASINNPYIVRYKEAFYDEDTKMICLVTELADGGDLNSLIAEHRKTKEVIS